MFNWFRPSCPLVTSEKVWIETRLNWLARRLGRDRLLTATVVEPEDEFSPGEFQATDDYAKQLYGRIAKHMQIDPAQVELRIYDELEGDALGMYVIGPPSMVWLSRKQLADPESLVGTLAHELAHHILLGGGLVQGNDEDLERLTDLLPVFLGAGIFGANSSLRENSYWEGQYYHSQIQKQGYLPIRMYGYALGLFAWARGETNPAWASHLRPDVRQPLFDGLRYARKANDCLFEIHDASLEPEKPNLETAIDRLRHRSASYRYLGLAELIELGPPAEAGMAEIERLLDDNDSEIPGMAAYALGIIGPPASAHADRLQDMLNARNSDSRKGAAFALGELRLDDPLIAQDLCRLLDDPDRTVTYIAIEALGKLGAAGDRVATQLLRKYESALVKCDFDAIDRMAFALWRVLPDARSAVRDHFSGLGADLLVFAEESLGESGPSDASDAQPVVSQRTRKPD
jgi:hypothetical protein